MVVVVGSSDGGSDSRRRMKRRRRPGLKEYQLTSNVRSLSRSNDYTFAPIIYQPIMARDLSLSSRFCNDRAMDVRALSKGSRDQLTNVVGKEMGSSLFTSSIVELPTLPPSPH